MQEDLIGSLTRQVREEVIQNYLTERRLVRLQIEEIENSAKQMKLRAVKVGRRLNRLMHLMIQAEMKKRLIAILQIPQPSFWSECTEKKLSRHIRFIRVSALTDKRKFRKLVLESYHRLYERTAIYEKGYESLRLDCEAVNLNIRSFQTNFDLLSILSFLRGLDTQTLERKQFLGENFTPEELASVDQKLYIKPISFQALNVPAPMPLRAPGSLEKTLIDLSDEVYRKSEEQVKKLMM